ncbi:MAG TPA: hypothetical protein VLJ39_18835 [Tepidisphaeraceae bacterium]|nr:hypothetical protein [Tepidisphaeraceae bacterium]
MLNGAVSVQPTELPLLQSDARAWRRLAYGAAAILAVAGAFTAWCDTPMIWDGAYQFAFSLIEQKPYFYLTRFHSYVLWLPMVWLSHVTSNLTVLKMAYGLPFTLAPAFSVLLSWYVVRKRAPRLILWAIFGAAAAPLPGQIFIINDSIFQQHMFWPVFLGLLVTLEWNQMAVLALLVVFQFSHQIGLVLLSGGAIAAGLLALRGSASVKQQWTKSILVFVLAGIALWKILHFPDSYAEGQFTWKAAHDAWLWGVRGYPLRGLEFMWAAGICLLVHRVIRVQKWEEQRRALPALAGLLVLAAAITWIIWASSSHRWTTAANYRRWVVPLSIPFYLLAFLDAWARRPARVEPNPAVRWISLVGYGVAGTFAVVITIQSVIWMSMTRRLMKTVEAYPEAVVPWSAISWTNDTALFHWGTASYVFVLEGKTPRHLVLDPYPQDSDRQLATLANGDIPLASFTPVSPDPGPAGWFDFRPLLHRARPGR